MCATLLHVPPDLSRPLLLLGQMADIMMALSTLSDCVLLFMFILYGTVFRLFRHTRCKGVCIDKNKTTVVSCRVLSCLALPCHILSCVVLSHLVLCCLVSSCRVVSCLVLLYAVLRCAVLCFGLLCFGMLCFASI